MSDIQRSGSGGRFSSTVVHGNIVYLCGITAKDLAADVTAQTRDILNQIDVALSEAGSDKSRILTAQIWLQNIDRDFAAMNQAWDEWLDKANMPTRATGESRLASPEVLVEIIITAAK
ncbi:RidA family protein [Pusillimonas sp. ANT_WB101]|uniref:RidA family protein n=1 Tax=Pusillimonas sp. ANT_WB101 TaxID=2597356 RepID=UPI0011ED8CEE|nr:RidA family protein [Pusillimonas sp. ANT_WB101]KAA0910628.1 RidA family protein [Pusillimonas sp. ANT_WB101]